ncbi:MAG: hypothetical protein AABX63_02180 [Nanoarchaeota archaeon]
MTRKSAYHTQPVYANKGGIVRLLNDVPFPIGFNPYEYLRDEYNRRCILKDPMALPEILVAGGDNWPIITDLKNGFTFEYDARAAQNRWQEHLHGNHFRGLEGKVLGTYAAMSEGKVRELRKTAEEDPSKKIDHVALWPLEGRRFDERYFLVIDVNGPALKNIEEALNVYHRVTEPGGFALVKVPTKTYDSEVSVKSMAEKYGFVVAQQGNRDKHTYFLLARRPTSS